jgi:hypothetical protein
MSSISISISSLRMGTVTELSSDRVAEKPALMGLKPSNKHLWLFQAEPVKSRSQQSSVSRLCEPRKRRQSVEEPKEKKDIDESLQSDANSRLSKPRRQNRRRKRVRGEIDKARRRAEEGPGPGEYKLPEISLSGGKFNESNPKSDIDWTIYRGQQLPAPNQYSIQEPLKAGGAFSMAYPKTDVDIKMKMAAQIPGPGQYQLGSTMDKLKGGHFNTAKSKTDLEIQIHRSKQMPGPGEYSLPAISPLPGAGKMSNASKKKGNGPALAITPGPGHYPGANGISPLPQGGKISESWVKRGRMDWVHDASLPGPGAYSPPKPPGGPSGIGFGRPPTPPTP